jgi:hypothetical protein
MEATSLMSLDFYSLKLILSYVIENNNINSLTKYRVVNKKFLEVIDSFFHSIKEITLLTRRRGFFQPPSQEHLVQQLKLHCNADTIIMKNFPFYGRLPIDIYLHTNCYMKTVILNNCRNIRPLFFKSLGNALPNLKNLEVIETILTQEEVNDITTCFPTLETLILRRIGYDWNGRQFSTFPMTLRNLELTMDHMGTISSQLTLENIANTCGHQLERLELTISNRSLIQWDTFDKKLENLAFFKIIIISRQTSQPMTLSFNIPSISVLEIIEYSFEQETNSITIEEINHVIRCSPNLKSLSISAKFNANTSLSSQAFKRLGRSCPELSQLYLDNIIAVDDDIFYELSQCNTLKQITFRVLPHISDFGFNQLMRRNNSLERIHLECCNGLTSDYIHGIIDAAKRRAPTYIHVILEYMQLNLIDITLPDNLLLDLNMVEDLRELFEIAIF